MKLAFCTISFRHQLVSLEQLVRWAANSHFQGIELWGVHASNLASHPEYYNQHWLRDHGLAVPMVSDYLPVDGDRAVAMTKATHLCQLAQRWGAPKLRTFAGTRASADVPREERAASTARVRELCEVAEAHGIQLVVETHPNTLADTLDSTVRFLEEVDHPALKLNFDVIHVWEGGVEPLKALRELHPFVVHMHLKNIASRDLLDQFAPPNVYAPAGLRHGMVGLFDGTFDYTTFLRLATQESLLCWDTLDASLEWFGPSVFETLNQDSARLSALDSELGDSPLNVTSLAIS